MEGLTYYHKATLNKYVVKREGCINKTTDDGKEWVFYEDIEGCPYIREKEEFLEKFQKETETLI